MIYELSFSDLTGGIAIPFIFIIGAILLYILDKKYPSGNRKLIIAAWCIGIAGTMFAVGLIYSGFSIYSKYIEGEFDTFEAEGVIKSISYDNNDEQISFETGQDFIHSWSKSGKCMKGKIADLKGVDAGSLVMITYEKMVPHDRGVVRCVLRVEVKNNFPRTS